MKYIMKKKIESYIYVGNCPKCGVEQESLDEGDVDIICSDCIISERIEKLDMTTLNKCPYCKELMLPFKYKLSHFSTELKHKFIDLYGDIPRRVESSWKDEKGIMCTICLREWQNAR